MKDIQDKLIYIILALLLLVPLSQSVFIVQEGHVGILLRFNKIVGEIDNDKEIIANQYQPGMHFKIPFMDKPVMIDVKLQTIVSEENINTQVRSPIEKEATQNMIRSVMEARMLINKAIKQTSDSGDDLDDDYQSNVNEFQNISRAYQVFIEQNKEKIYNDRDEFLTPNAFSPEQNIVIKDTLGQFNPNINSMFDLGKELFKRYRAIYSNDVIKSAVLNHENSDDQAEPYSLLDERENIIFDYESLSSDSIVGPTDDSTTKYLNTNFYVKYRLNLDDSKGIAQFYTWTKNGQFSNAELNVKKTVKSKIIEILKRTNITKVITGDIRDEIANTLREELNREFKNDKKWGVKIVDIRLKKIDYPDESKDAVYKRMRSEQETQSQKIQAQGEAEKRILIAEGEKEAEGLLQQANVDARKAEATAERDATVIFNTFYGNEKQRKIFELLYQLDAISETVTKEDTLIVSDGNTFFSPLTNTELKS